MHFSTLYEWLNWISAIHFATIDMGLMRIKNVADALQLLPIKQKVIVVAGTNGKGSTVAALESIYRNSGYSVGCFTSPILFKHNEQVRINGLLPSDADFCAAYEKIETARKEVTLTPFEYHTLAALILFQQYKLDLLILEVGMGGRLDAVNIVDADASVVTSIAIDHAQWLGDTREAIAIEKAGIFRANHPAICGDPNPPETLLIEAKRLNTLFYQQGKDFHYDLLESSWNWHSKHLDLSDLPYNSLLTQNMSTTLMTVQSLQHILPVSEENIKRGLKTVSLPARIQIVDWPVKHIFDVSHNPAAIALLAATIQQLRPKGKVLAIFSMLTDKDIEESVKAIKDVIDEWYIAPLQTARAASMKMLTEALHKNGVDKFNRYETISSAYDAALSHAEKTDLIIIFGSFHTIAESSVQPI